MFLNKLRWESLSNYRWSPGNFYPPDLSHICQDTWSRKKLENHLIRERIKSSNFKRLGKKVGESALARLNDRSC